MEQALRAAVDRVAPGVWQAAQIRVRQGKDSLLLEGTLNIQDATRFNIGLQAFMRDDAAKFMIRKVSRENLSIVVPRVRLGDVTTEKEREVLAACTENRTYLDPDAQIKSPEWNVDFVSASDRRMRQHIKPRYQPDPEEDLDLVANFVAQLCQDGGVVVHTGAGISANAGIATYREGSSSSVAMSAALPTYAHYALVALTQMGAVDYVSSQNVDGLHRRSGMAADKLSELHGNSYIEICSCCNPPMEFVRPYDAYSTPPAKPTFWGKLLGSSGARRWDGNVEPTENELKSGIMHVTGRACPKGKGPLRDSIIHFGESLPVVALQRAEENSKNAVLNLVIGSSLLVTPAASLPFAGKSPVAIVSRTCTGADIKALNRGGVILRADSDAVIERIFRFLAASGRFGPVHFPNTPEYMEKLHARVRERDQAVLAKDGDVPYDGGADGGVVQLRLLQAPSPPRRLQPVLRERPPLPLQLRQTHEPDTDGWHRWSLSLERADAAPLSAENLAEVRFRLHETFDPSVHVLKEPPFAIGPFKGWGTFTIVVEVKQCPDDREPYKVKFPLSFDSPEKVLSLAVAGGA